MNTPPPVDQSAKTTSYETVLHILADGWQQQLPPYDPATLQQYIQVKQYQLLKAINGKLAFIVIIIILSLILTFFMSLF